GQAYCEAVVAVDGLDCGWTGDGQVATAGDVDGADVGGDLADSVNRNEYVRAGGRAYGTGACGVWCYGSGAGVNVFRYGLDECGEGAGYGLEVFTVGKVRSVSGLRGHERGYDPEVDRRGHHDNDEDHEDLCDDRADSSFGTAQRME